MAISAHRFTRPKMESSKFQLGTYSLQAIRSESVTDDDSEVSYADMNDGSWAIVIQSQENDFVIQREFDLTAGGAATAVIITVRSRVPVAFPAPGAPTNTSRLPQL